jgi:hypothetical protein
MVMRRGLPDALSIFRFLKGVFRMREHGASIVIGLILLACPAIASSQGAPAVKTYGDCIVYYAGQALSPQAAVIMQRACFYNYRYGKDYITSFGNPPEHRKLAKIYTPAVCECIFENMPGASPSLPATRILDGCVKSSGKQIEPDSR